jgi:D-3-phosphoglycerate dehydrogenase / 2-oxoglutarate reductase
MLCQKNFRLIKNTLRFCLLEGIHPSSASSFESAGYTNVEYLKTALDGEQLEQKLKDIHILGIRSRTQLTNQVLKKAKKLFAVGCFSIGTNQVDLLAAKEHGVPVFNAPFSNTRSVAELVIAEIIMLMREVPCKKCCSTQGRLAESGGKLLRSKREKIRHCGLRAHWFTGFNPGRSYGYGCALLRY